MTLAALQSRLQALVAAEPLLAGRPVFIEDKQNLVSVIGAALAETSLCVAIAPASGAASEAAAPQRVSSGTLPRRAASGEVLEIAIYRGLIDAPEVPSTVVVLDALRSRLHGALIDASNPRGGRFAYVRHDLRDQGDGVYVRVLQVAATVTIAPPTDT